MKLIVGIGLISYSAYLWHQPILAFARYRVLGDLPDPILLILCVLSLLLAWASWRYVEAPFRNRQAFSRKSIFLMSASGIVAFSVIGLVLFFSNDFSTYKDNAITERLSQIGIEGFEPNNRKLQEESWDLIRDLYQTEHYAITDNPVDKINNYDLSSNKTPILVVGNSHSVDVFNILYYSNTNSQKLSVARYGVQLSEIDTDFFTSDAYKYSQAIVLATYYSNDDLEALPELSSRILQDNKQLFIVEQVFTFTSNATNTLSDYIIAKELQNDDIRLEDLRDKVNSNYTNLYLSNSTDQWFLRKKRKFESVKARINVECPQVVFLSRMDYICPNNWCHGLTPDGRKTFFDYGHHTTAGAIYFGEQLPETKFYRDLMAGLEQ